MKPLLSFILIFILWNRSSCRQPSIDPDPRLNASLYDFKISGSFNTDHLTIGNVSHILLARAKINRTTHVSNYKLIYYSPQLTPSSAAAKAFARNVITDSDGLFKMNILTGSIQLIVPTNKPILKYLCQEKQLCPCHSCIFTLNFIYSTKNKITSDSVRVFVDDYNENSPYFSAQAFILNISESSHIGQVFNIDRFVANDSDPYYNQITYYLSDKNIDWTTNPKTTSNLFDIQMNSDNNNKNGLSLVLKTHLDYELTKSHNVYLIAEDNGKPVSLRTVKKLVINVLDDNDNSPKCGENIFLASVSENELVDNFLQIKATDIDGAGANSELRYAIMSRELMDANTFSIDQYTGWLSLKEALDYERKSSYDLLVEVMDGGDRVRRTRCTARVNVLDANDNAAKVKIIEYLDESVGKGFYSFNARSASFSASGGGASGGELEQIRMYENNAPGMVLALIKVFDRDEISEYRFSILPAVYGTHNVSMFKINKRSAREFELITTSAFDAEQEQNYQLKIFLYDLQTVTNNTKQHAKKSGGLFQISLFLNVHVMDVNDNGPAFMQSAYNFSLEENRSHIRLPPIYVIDDDVEQNKSKTVFTVSPDYIASHFFLAYTQNLLSLTVEMPFDYEQHTPLLEFNVTVFDDVGRNASCSVQLHLIDVNDNPPQFMNANSTFYVRENNADADSFIGQVLAVDQDSQGANSDISYRFISNEPSNSFKIYKSGMIFSNNFVFDREVQDYYLLQVQAYNQIDNTSSHETFHVKVTDDNDNRPSFIYPPPDVDYLNIEKLEHPKRKNQSKLLTVRAADADIGLNGRLVYYIYDSLDLLTINRHTGDVLINYSKINRTRNEDECLKRVLDVSLTVRDLGEPSLEAVKNFTLYMNFGMNEMPLSVLRTVTGADVEKNTSWLNLDTMNSSQWSALEVISNNILVIVVLVIILVFMILITCYVLIAAFRRSKGLRKFQSKFCTSMSKTLTNANSLTVKDAPFVIEHPNQRALEASIRIGANTSCHDNNNSSEFTSVADPSKLTSVFDPDYLNDFYSKILFKPSGTDHFDSNPLESDSSASIDILGELYEESQKCKNYENIDYSSGKRSGSIFKHRAKEEINQDSNNTNNSLSAKTNMETLNSYIYSLPNLIDDNFPGAGRGTSSSFRLGTAGSRTEFSESQASFLQAENQILLDSSAKTSSDEMLKQLLEKFEIIYNDAVIQSRPSQLPKHSLDISIACDNQHDS